MKDLERIAQETREKAEAARREREEAHRAEAERRRAESERIAQERRARIEADNRERRERLDAARREREEALSRGRAAPPTATQPVAPPPPEAIAAAPTPAPAPPRAHAPVAAPARAPRRHVAVPPEPRATATVAPDRARETLTRVLKAARGNRETYEEVEADRSATTPALIIAAAAALAAAIGMAKDVSIEGLIGIARQFGVGMLGWGAYVTTTYLIGTSILRGRETKADWGELARTLGFASAPRVLLAIPGFEGFVWLWALGTTVVAIRAALDITTRRAIAVGISSWFVLLFVQAFATGFVRGLSR